MTSSTVNVSDVDDAVSRSCTTLDCPDPPPFTDAAQDVVAPTRWAVPFLDLVAFNDESADQVEAKDEYRRGP